MKENEPDVHKRNNYPTTKSTYNIFVRDQSIKDLRKLREELKPYKNTLVIDGWNKLVRLAGVRNGSTDYYWVYDEGRKISGESVVGKWIPLKGFIPDDDYNRLVRSWNLNYENKVR